MSRILSLFCSMSIFLTVPLAWTSEPNFDANPAPKNLSFSELATKFNIPTSGSDCPYSIDELVTSTPPGTIVDYGKSKLSDQEQQKWNCQHLRRHLETDSLQQCRPDPTLLQSGEAIAKKEMGGKIRYFMFVKEPYKYSLERDAQGLWTVTVRIAFQDYNPSTLHYWENRMKDAEDIWNSAPSGPYKITYKFLRVEAQDNPHFTIKLYDQESGYSRHRFNDGWGGQYNIWTIAHEIGHMLGLNEEYDMASSFLPGNNSDYVTKARCTGKQLMCNSWWRAEIASYYHYLILRRGLCQP